MDSVMATASRVFAIPELLENILLHLPECDLLLAQRVNKSFRDVNTASLHLQRKLFFTADVKSEYGMGSDLKWNPFIHVALGLKIITLRAADTARKVCDYHNIHSPLH